MGSFLTSLSFVYILLAIDYVSKWVGTKPLELMIPKLL